MMTFSLTCNTPYEVYAEDDYVVDDDDYSKEVLIKFHMYLFHGKS